MNYFEGTRTLSPHVDYFEHQGEFYVFHNLFGYILQMSRDVIVFLEFFKDARGEEEVGEAFGEVLEVDQLVNYLNVFESQSCLLEADDDEDQRALSMVPVQGRWALAYDAGGDEPVKLYLARQEREPVEVLVLSTWQTALWRLMDGERTLAAIVEALEEDKALDQPEGGFKDAVLGFLHTYAHHRYQLLKLSPRPMSTFRVHTSRRAVPPYLSSSMPYRCITDEIRGLEIPEGDVPVVEMREEPEVTLSHLMRQPHPALGGLTYGGILFDTLRQHHDTLALDDARVLLLGERRGHLARNLIEHTRDMDDVSLRVVIQTPSDKDKARILTDLGPVAAQATVLVGSAEHLDQIDSLEGPFALILCNEALASYETVLMRKIPNLTPNTEGDEEEASAGKDVAKPSRDLFMGEGDSVSYVFRYSLGFDDVDGEFFLNLGAIRVMEQAASLLASSGLMALVEFGDLFRYPEPSPTGGQLQYSLHFTPLMKVGRELGLEPTFDWLVNLLDFDRGMQMLTTTTRYFRALQRMMEDLGIELDDIAWSQDMLAEALGDKVSMNEVQGLDFQSLNDRVMGIVPSSLKILILKREGGAETLQL